MNAPTRATPAAAQPLVCIVDDDPFVADALIRLLEVVGYHSRRWPDADAFLTGIDPGQAGCLLLDIRLPGRSGLELLAALPDYGIGMPTIVMTGYANVATAVRAMKLGALDLLEKPLTGARCWSSACARRSNSTPNAAGGACMRSCCTSALPG